jgi:hypothetical protein
MAIQDRQLPEVYFRFGPGRAVPGAGAADRLGSKAEVGVHPAG